ncbi:hypothetical protein MLD38_001089 [Melastoma candidum]|uniref:Uncharacterized protein n=1 Tax=Melastoma candidum TaxID=119954 RepID=A0ACB9SKR4_9MYRT|nr:hypothetical protein MLD38_001089 [Melastoma candidum]
MKKSSSSKVQRPAASVPLMIALLFSALVRAEGLRANPSLRTSAKEKLRYDRADGDEGERFPKEDVKEEVGTEELYPTGSGLPDCSHACGPCVPCKRVMVSYKCATESCPVIYRCMCKGKYYHVPSN